MHTSLAREALSQAQRQGAGRAEVQSGLLVAASEGGASLDAFLRREGDSARPWVTTMAELFLNLQFDPLEHTRAVVRQEALARPERWRLPLRTALEQGTRTSTFLAASLLELMGEPRDVRLLRRFAKDSKGAGSIGRALAKRVADRAQVSDLGRVSVLVGDRQIPGDSVRRKVLALLCFLITRPGMSAARDQVVDALWPDQDPDAASNSLNQTVYFLRRVFEPQYVEDVSPGYVHHEADLLWLDSELVQRGVRSRADKQSNKHVGRPVGRSIELVSQAVSGPIRTGFRVRGVGQRTTATTSTPHTSRSSRGP